MQRMPRTALAQSIPVDARRQKVYEWIIGGYTIGGKTLTVRDLAKRMGANPSDIRKDIHAIRNKLSNSIATAPAFRTRVLSTLNTALEMSLRDRGMVMEQVEKLRNVVNDSAADLSSEKYLKVVDRLANMLKLAQNSNRQLIDMIRAVSGVGSNVNVVVNTGGGDAKVMTTEEALALIGQHETINVLPTSKSVS